MRRKFFIDWAAVMLSALAAERTHIYEVVGEALSHFREDLLDDVEQMIKEQVEQLQAKKPERATRRSRIASVVQNSSRQASLCDWATIARRVRDKARDSLSDRRR